MNDRPAHGDRLSKVRAELSLQGLDGLLVPRADEHLGEYVPASAERLAWLTGFTGSAGMAVVLADHAAAFTDGRYVLQLAGQTDPALWERRHITDEPPAGWIIEKAGRTARIGYDPLLFSEDQLARFTEAGVTLAATSRNPIDVAWTDRPAAPMAPALPHPLQWSGVTSEQKREDIAAVLRKAGQDAAVLTDPASIAWLLNLRGGDVPFTPFALGFALVGSDAACELFMEAEKLPPETRDWLGNGVSVQPRSALAPALAGLHGKRVRVDAGGSPSWFSQRLREAGADVVAAADPCLLPKACKNDTECRGARAAHRRDAVAVCRFLHWLTGAAGRESEISAAAQLLRFRAELPLFQGEAFPAISGAGEDGAIIHYRVTPQSNRPINPDEVYLCDSGAQFSDGTTDITRTVWTGPGEPASDLRERVTRVLKGHIAIATLVFPEGVCGAHLDSFARQALWQVGLDYDHGTGHGVGSYLSVHEGPVSLSRAARPVPLAEGMILSNEPGFYLPGAYGVRLENLLLVRRAERPNATKPFLCFETLSLAPFDRRLIDPSLLTDGERDWLDAYHARVLAEIGPALADVEREWLRGACAALPSRLVTSSA